MASGIGIGKRPGQLETSGKGAPKRIVVSKHPELVESASKMPPMTEHKSEKPGHVGGITGGKVCTLCGGMGHSAKSHVSGQEGEASGPAVTQNKATQFGTSLSWAGGGEANSQQQGSSNYKAPGRSEGGMS